MNSRIKAECNADSALTHAFIKEYPDHIPTVGGVIKNLKGKSNKAQWVGLIDFDKKLNKEIESLGVSSYSSDLIKVFTNEGSSFICIYIHSGLETFLYKTGNQVLKNPTNYWFLKPENRNQFKKDCKTSKFCSTSEFKSFLNELSSAKHKSEDLKKVFEYLSKAL